MAADWIKVDVTTPDKPEVFRMAERLGIDPDAVVGKLIRVWVWADQQTTNGNAPSVTRLLLDRATNVSGFADAMINVGWLVESDHGLTFPNFDRHNGKTAKTRALTVHRVRQHRNANVTKAALLRDRDREDIVDTAKADSQDSKPKKPRAKTVTRRDYSPEFLSWYQACPRKEAKPLAYKEFEPALERIVAERKIGRDEAIEWLMKRTTEYAFSVAGKETCYIKTPRYWLSEDRFNDQSIGKTAPSPPIAKPKHVTEAEEIERERRLKQQATKEA